MCNIQTFAKRQYLTQKERWLWWFVMFLVLNGQLQANTIKMAAFIVSLLLNTVLYINTYIQNNVKIPASTVKAFEVLLL